MKEEKQSESSKCYEAGFNDAVELLRREGFIRLA